VVICLERGANDLHTVQLMPLPPRPLLLQQNPEWFILPVPAYPGCPGKKAVKRWCVSVCVETNIHKLTSHARSQWNHAYTGAGILTTCNVPSRPPAQQASFTCTQEYLANE